MRGPVAAGQPADEYYLEARDAALQAARALTRRRGRFHTPDGTTLRVNFRTPLRLYLLMIDRQAPGQEHPTGFSFQRNGRVNLSGDRKVPLREAAARGHEPWASRAELEDLAAQLRTAAGR
jgi:hypothetical protein